MRKDDSEGHELLSLVGGVAKHHTLVAGANVLVTTADMHSLGNLGGLLLDGNLLNTGQGERGASGRKKNMKYSQDQNFF